jgi:hypothetical protein
LISSSASLTGWRAAFYDGRFAPLVEHQLPELLRQRIGALALGHEDINDHDRLRLDPMHALLQAHLEADFEELHRRIEAGGTAIPCRQFRTGFIGSH